MPKYTQSGLALAITTPLGPDVLLLEQLTGTEGLSRLFRFKLDMLAEQPVDFNKLLGKSATVTLTLPNGTGRFFSGVIRRLNQEEWIPGPDGKKTFLRYRAQLVPALWFLTRRRQSRIFQQISVPDILKKVLKDDWQLDLSLKLTAAYEPRNYCVQYRESDFAFVSRLMEEEGITYHFEHQEEGHTLVLTDSPASFSVLPKPAVIVHDPSTPGWKDEPRIHNWRKRQEVRVSKHTIRDWSFQLPDKELNAAASASGSVHLGSVAHNLSQPHPVNGTEMLEDFEYPAAFGHRFDGIGKEGNEQPQELPKVYDYEHHLAKVRQERETAGGLSARGAGDAGHFVPGFKFNLSRHFDADDSYLLRRVTHRASIEGVYTAGGKVETIYENEFDCLPAALTYRPRACTPWPRIDGLQTATVVGPKGENVFVDKYGRVKVQFRWDREGKLNEGSSCWVRVAQAWAGKRWGAFFWPRIGHEVVVAFEEGDPDRPLIVGSVYNAQNMPPFALPADVSASGIKSCSLGGEPLRDFNWLVFHDAADDEHVHIHSENHEIITSEASRHRYTPGPSIEVMGASPFATTGSGGGGGSFSIGAGSGSGGGLLDVLDLAEVAGGHNAPGWLQSYGHAFPGAANFVWGNVISSSFLGDQVKHALLGANVTLVVDPEGIAEDYMGLKGHAIYALMYAAAALYTPSSSGEMFGAALAGAISSLIPAACGNFNLILGPNTSLTYMASNLSVTRGHTYKYDTKSFWDDLTPSGIAIKALTLVIAVGGTAADICGKVYGGTATEGGEWAALASRAFVQRLMGVLRKLEQINAIAKNDESKAAEATKTAELSAKLIATVVTEAMNRATPLVDGAALQAREAIRLTAEGLAALTGRVTALADDVGRTNKVYQGNYSLTAQNLSFISTPPSGLMSGLPVINISAPQGVVSIDGDKQVAISSKSVSGIATIGVKVDSLQGNIDLTNSLAGCIILTQGIEAAPAKIMLKGPPPEIAMSAGPPIEGASLNMKPTGITLSVGAPGTGASLSLELAGATLKFMEWSLAMNATGITLSAGPSTVKLTPAAIEQTSLNAKQIADLQIQVQTIASKMQTTAVQSSNAAVASVD